MKILLITLLLPLILSPISQGGYVSISSELNDLCLTQDTPVRLETCDTGRLVQHWQISKQGTAHIIRSGWNSECLTVARNQKPITYRCRNLRSQRFDIVANDWGKGFQIQLQRSDLCLDVVDWQIKDPAALQFYQCHIGINQQFSGG